MGKAHKCRVAMQEGIQIRSGLGSLRQSCKTSTLKHSKDSLGDKDIKQHQEIIRCSAAPQVSVLVIFSAEDSQWTVI